MNKPPRQTVTFEQLTYSNMLTLNALVELLTEKGVLSKPEILERIEKLQAKRRCECNEPRCSQTGLRHPTPTDRWGQPPRAHFIVAV